MAFAHTKKVEIWTFIMARNPDPTKKGPDPNGPGSATLVTRKCDQCFHNENTRETLSLWRNEFKLISSL
jgi:hypothetical protein